VLTIDDDDIEALAGQPLGNQRARDTPANDQRIACEAFAKQQRSGMPDGRKPRGMAASQVGLFGLVGIKNADSLSNSTG
jgi:hypothetical protein